MMTPRTIRVGPRDALQVGLNIGRISTAKSDLVSAYDSQDVANGLRVLDLCGKSVECLRILIGVISGGGRIYRIKCL
jgi:hypothetical protein